MQSTDSGGTEELDPFDPEFVPAFTLITLMRLYDVGMALLNEQNSDVASRLHNAHSKGKVIGTFPWLDADDEIVDSAI